MKRNKQQKYRMKIIQEFHLNKNTQRLIDEYFINYEFAYNLLTRKSNFKINFSKFTPDRIIEDYDKNSIVPNMMKKVELNNNTLQKYFNITGGNKHA